jgi:type IV secretion system protein TrbL
MVSLLLQLGPAPGVPVVGDPGTLTAAYQALVPIWIGRVWPYSQEIFGALALLDLAFLGWNLMRRHGDDVRGALLGMTNRVLLIGLFLDLMLNGPTWMGAVIDIFVTSGKAAGNAQIGLNPSSILLQGLAIAGVMLGQASLNNIMLQPLTGLAVLFAAAAIFVSFCVISIKFVLVQVQTFFALGMSTLFLAFGASTWTRTYVERFFSYAVSSGIQLMVLYVLAGTGMTLSNTWLQQAKAAPWSIAGVQACWLIGAGAVLFGVLCWNNAAMAAMLLGGGPNLSHGEVFQAMSTAISAGVATALVASGVGTAAGAALGAGTTASGAGATATIGASAATSGATPTVSPRAAMQSVAYAGSSVSGVLSSMNHGGGHSVSPPSFRGFGE